MYKLLWVACTMPLVLLFGCQSEVKNASTAAPQGKVHAGGQILHIDPETGKRGTPTAEDLAELELYSPPGVAGERKGQVQGEGGTIVQEFSHPTYSRGMTNPEGLLRKPLVVTIEPNGEPKVTHAPEGYPKTETTSESQ